MKINMEVYVLAACRHSDGRIYVVASPYTLTQRLERGQEQLQQNKQQTPQFCMSLG